MTRLYVAAAGSATNLGTTTAAPITLDRANTLMGDGSIGPGDQVLFRRGDSFAGILLPPSFDFDGRYVTVGAYGVGARPIITPYKVLNTSGGWLLHSAGIYKIDLTDPATHTGYTASNTNIGHLLVDGVIYGKRVWATADLANPWDFYCDATYLYVAASANPTTLAANIKAAPNVTICPLRKSLQLVGLDLCGTGGHAVAGTATDYHRIVGNVIRQVGGSVGGGGPTTRYGNGLQVFIGTQHGLYQSNVFLDGYDTATTMQGEYVPGSTGSTWADVVFRRNYIARWSQAFEVWTKGPSGSLQAIWERNIAAAIGQGWSHGVRIDPEVEAFLLFYGMTTNMTYDLTIRENTFVGGKSDVIHYRRINGETTTGVKRYSNKVVLPTTAYAEKVRDATDPATYVSSTAVADAVSASTEPSSAFAALPSTVATAADVLQHAAATSMASAHDLQDDHVAFAASEALVAASTALAALRLADGSNTRETNQSSTGTDYAKLATLQISGAFSFAELIMGYSMPSPGTSIANGANPTGVIKIQLDAQLTPKASLNIVEDVPFGTGASAIKRTDFHLVVTAADDTAHTYTAELWVQMRKTFQAIRTWPIAAYPQGQESYSLTPQAGTGTWKMWSGQALTTLPAGTDATTTTLRRLGMVAAGVFGRATTLSVADSSDVDVNLTDATVEYQNITFHSTGTNPEQIVIPAELDGMLMDLSAVLTYTPNATGRRFLKLKKNGTQVDADVRAAMATGATTLRLSYSAKVTAGDVYKMTARHEAGTTITVDPGSGRVGVQVKFFSVA